MHRTARALLRACARDFWNGMNAPAIRPILIGGSIALAGVGLAGALSACTAAPVYPDDNPASTATPWQYEPYPTPGYGAPPPGTVTLPDGIIMISVCDHRNRIYRPWKASDQAPTVVVTADPTCPKDVPQ